MLPFVLLGIAGVATATGPTRLVPEWRMRRLHPAEPATRLAMALRAGASPYR